MKEDEDLEVGYIKYDETTIIRFFLNKYKSLAYANIRSYINTDLSSEPTKKGVRLTKKELSEIVTNCSELDLDLNNLEEKIICKIKKEFNKNIEIYVKINLYDGKYGFEIREMFKDKRGDLLYGRGIRINIEYAIKAIELLKQMNEKFEDNSKVNSEFNNQPLPKIIKQSYFFVGKLSGNIITSKTLNEISLNKISFSERFNSCLKSHNYLQNLSDLLNTDYVQFIMHPNCGEKSINEARFKILELLNNFTSISKYNSEPPFPFLQNLEFEVSNDFNDILSLKLDEVDFDIRFQHVLEQFPKIKTVKDLLNTNPNELINLKNCGKSSIKKAQDKILNLFSGKFELVLSDSKKLDEYIEFNLHSLIKDKRNLEMFFTYYNCNTLGKTNLAQIGLKYGLTRERVRQIIGVIIRKISKSKFVFSYLVKEMKNFGYVYELEKFISYLTDNKKCKKENKKFLEFMIKEFVDNYDNISISGRYVLSIKLDTFLPILIPINEFILVKVKDLQNGVEVSDMIILLNENIESVNNIEVKNFLNSDALTFISEKFKKFYLVDNMIYNEMMFNIYFGKKLKEVIYWSMKYFSESIHFTQLADFIRKNNRKHYDTPDSSVHSILVNSKICNLAGYGTYIIKDTNQPVYRSATNSIKIIIKENGPLTEDKIIKILDSKYSLTNIKTSLKNNVNKQFIKIGNDLYDLKH